MCILIVEGRPVLVAYTGGEITTSDTATKKQEKDMEVAEKHYDSKVSTMICSATRSKTAVNEDQKSDRRERNRARRKIVIGKRTACQVTKYNLEKDAVVTTTEMLPDDSYLVTVSHRSAGLHGGKPRYKDHRLDAIGKAGELRAKHKRPFHPI
jgi:hypothetical protein